MLTTPREIREWLSLEEGASPPITIMTQTGALEADLLGWVRRPGTDKLQAEPFMVVPQTLSHEFKDEFSRLTSGAVNNWKDLPAVIASVIGQKDVTSKLDFIHHAA